MNTNEHPEPRPISPPLTDRERAALRGDTSAYIRALAAELDSDPTTRGWRIGRHSNGAGLAERMEMEYEGRG